MSTSDDSKAVVSDLEGAVLTVHQQLDMMEKFIARRFDEISMEINATAQQVELGEAGIDKRFAEIMDILSAISYRGDTNKATAANTGVELEAVIGDTEEAANKILDAADRIAVLVQDREDWQDDKKREELLARIKQDVQDILLACTFQDLTGQRIRKTLENLHLIEERLSGTLERLGIKVKVDPASAVKSLAGNSAQSQADIDAMFGS